MGVPAPKRPVPRAAVGIDCGPAPGTRAARLIAHAYAEARREVACLLAHELYVWRPFSEAEEAWERFAGEARALSGIYGGKRRRI